MPDFKAKMHKIRFTLGLRPRPAWGAYSAFPDPLAVFKGSTSKGRAQKEGGEEKGEGKGREEECGESGENGGKGRGQAPQIFWPRTALANQ